MTRINQPTLRLRDAPIGAKVKLAGVERVLELREIRDDGYRQLYYGPYLSVTAAPCHEVEYVK